MTMRSEEDETRRTREHQDRAVPLLPRVSRHLGQVLTVRRVWTRQMAMTMSRNGQP
jgi:hypothetical protein